MEFRAIGEREWDNAMALWTTVFGDVGWIFQSLHDGTSDRSPEHTRVAVEDGKIVSAVDIFMREMRGIDGRPLKVGGIGSVATYDAYRRQGLSGRLLTDAIAVMEREGCAWSFLFTATHHHYAKYGWFTLPLTGRYGNLRPTFELIDTKGYKVTRLGEADAWPLAEMAKIYGEFNGARPLSHLRDEKYWAFATRARLERPGRESWGAWHDGALIAYASAASDDDTITLDEVGCLTGHEESLAELFAEIHARAIRAGKCSAQILLPTDSGLDPLVEAFAGPTEVRDRSHTMVRTLAGGLSEAELRKLFAAPGRCHYELDNF